MITSQTSQQAVISISNGYWSPNMHIFGFLARTVTPLHEHSPDGPYLHGLRGAAHFGGHGSSQGGGHAGLQGGGQTGLHGASQGGGHAGLQGWHTGLHGGGHTGWHGSQMGSQGWLQSSPQRLLQPVQSSADTPKKTNEANIPSCFLIN